MTVVDRREYLRFWRLASPKGREKGYRNTLSARASAFAARKRYRQSPGGRAAHCAQEMRRQKTPRGRALQQVCHKRYRQTLRAHILSAARTGKREAMKLGLTVQGWGFEIDAFWERAAELRENFLYVSVDHIIPLAQGGSHAPWNLQIILHHENCEKGDRPDYEPSVIFI